MLEVERALALNVKPGRAQACPNFPRASFEPELSTNKNANIRVRAYGKIRLVEPRAWGLFTASPKSGPGLRARVQARSTSISCVSKLDRASIFRAGLWVLGLESGSGLIILEAYFNNNNNCATFVCRARAMGLCSSGPRAQAWARSSSKFCNRSRASQVES